MQKKKFKPNSLFHNYYYGIKDKYKPRPAEFHNASFIFYTL
jgi:hypothetical protein